MKKSEHEIQRNSVAKVRRMLKRKGYSPRLLFAIPNGGTRSMREASRFKMEGVVAGIPDTFLSIPSGGWGGLYMEFKTPTGRLSKSQQEVMSELFDQGYIVVVVRSEEDCIKTVTDYMGW